MGVEKKIKKVAKKKYEEPHYEVGLRIATILHLLYRSPHGVKRKEIQRILGVSVDTIRRYKRNVLPEIIIDGEEIIVYEGDGDDQVWKIKDTLSFKDKNINDLLSVYMAENLMRFLEGTSPRGRVSAVATTIKNNLSAFRKEQLKDFHKKIYFHPYGPKTYKDKSGNIDTILKALIHNEKLKIKRTLGGGVEKTFTCTPLTLLMYKSALYLVVKSDHPKSRGIPKTNRLEDIIEVTRLEEKFTYPKNYDPQKYFQNSFGIIRGEKKKKVKIWFSKNVAENAKSRKWHPSQKVTKVKDGINMTFELEGTRELVPWILSYGFNAKVISPKDIAQEVKNTLKEAYNIYR